MITTNWFTTIALAVALVSGVALARPALARTGEVRLGQDNCRDDVRRDRDERCSERRHQPRDRYGARANPVLRTVPNGSLPDQASYGWQYFSNARAAHAVVISPAGEYFLSLGDGPRQITGPAGQLLAPRPARE